MRRMVAQQGAPALRGWLTSLGHILGDRRLSDRKAELEQLTMDARRTPEQILSAHPPDQRPQVRTYFRTPSQGAGFPAPRAPKAGTMPAHEGLGPDDRDGLEDRWKPTIQLDEEQAITGRKVNTTAHLALQDNQLVPEHGILCLKSATRLERRGQQRQEET